LISADHTFRTALLAQDRSQQRLRATAIDEVHHLTVCAIGLAPENVKVSDVP
jgi:hypothetical protein